MRARHMEYSYEIDTLEIRCELPSLKIKKKKTANKLGCW